MVSLRSALQVQEIAVRVRRKGQQHLMVHQQQLKMRQWVNPPSYTVSKEGKKYVLRMSNWEKKEGLSNLQVCLNIALLLLRIYRSTHFQPQL
jgi:hypothetical protein